MECTLFLLADYANVASDNKLNVMGIFTAINASQFPVIHPQMYIVAQLSATAHEYGRSFRFEVKLIDEDATWELTPVRAKFEVPRPPSGTRVQLNMILAINNQKFDAPGTYEFSVLIDGDVKATLPVELVRISPAIES